MLEKSGEHHLVLVTPKVPPTKDGVGDYTYHLGKELSKTTRVSILTTRGQREDGDSGPFRVLPVVPCWDVRGIPRLLMALKTLKPSLINVQWVPFLWGKWGINLALPLTVLWLRQAGYRVVTTVHEPYVPLDTCKHLLMGSLQRLELWLTILGSAKVAVTISAWTQMLQRLFPGKRREIFWLAVGSNIPKVLTSQDERAQLRYRFGVGGDGLLITVFNLSGTGKMIDLVCKTWESIRRRHKNAKLLLLGSSLEEIQRQPLLVGDHRVIYTGYLEAAEVSRFLSCSDLLLAPFVDGVSARRSSVITAMEHGLPIVTTRGSLTDCELFDRSPLILTDVSDEKGFIAASMHLAANAQARASLLEDNARFYQNHFSWSLIAQRLMQECLDESEQRGVVGTVAHRSP